MAEAQLAAAELAMRVLQPACAQNLVRQVSVKSPESHTQIPVTGEIDYFTRPDRLLISDG